MSDGMDGRDSYAEEEQAGLDQVVLAKTFFFFFTFCLLGSQMGRNCLPHKTNIMRVKMSKFANHNIVNFYNIQIEIYVVSHC